MSQEMRNMINKNNELVSKLAHLKRRLSPEIMEDISNAVKSPTSVNESSLSRITKHLMSHDCAVITSFRNELINCVYSEKSSKVLNTFDNKGRNKPLNAALLYLGYGVTNVKGTYIENYLQDNSIAKSENSFFVVNLNDDLDFIENIIELGTLFCQDSVLIMEKGGDNNYLVGTNYAEFPGYENIFSTGKFKPGLEGEFMTQVGGRPFVIETFKSYQNNSKKIILDMGRPIININKNK
jgi:hypothetical protein